MEGVAGEGGGSQSEEETKEKEGDYGEVERQRRTGGQRRGGNGGGRRKRGRTSNSAHLRVEINTKFTQWNVIESRSETGSINSALLFFF